MDHSPAPIILFTYKRLKNVKNVLHSLSKCQLSDESEILVFSDAAKSLEDKDKVEEVRNYLRSVKDFKSFSVVERQTNLGVDYNIINGIKEAAERFNRFIILEDDLLLSENFLSFMNQALDFYADHSEVLSVNGFSYVQHIPTDYKYDIYFARRSWSWGWGTWSDKIKCVDWNVSDFEEFENSTALQKRFNESGGSDLTKMLKETMHGKIRAWDIRLFYHQFKAGYISAYPVISKTINIGFHSEGSNTFGYNRYKTTLDSSGKVQFNFKKKATVEETINNEFLKKNNFNNRLLTRLYSLIGLH